VDQLLGLGYAHMDHAKTDLAGGYHRLPAKNVVQFVFDEVSL
jgi:hypothetical protein